MDCPGCRYPATDQFHVTNCPREHNIHQRSEEEAIDFLTDTVQEGECKVYVWKSARQRGGEGYGHISLTFGREYVSFWPANRPSNPFERVPGHFNDRHEDHGCKGRDPDEVYSIHDLDLKAMSNFLQEQIEAQPDWALVASSPFTYANTWNCTSLAVEMLRVGGVEALANRTFVERERFRDNTGPLEYRRNDCDLCTKRACNTFGLSMCWLMLGGLSCLGLGGVLLFGLFKWKGLELLYLPLELLLVIIAMAG